MRPALILAAFRSRYDRTGQFWTADRYFQGGSLVQRTPVEGTTDPDLFTSERQGNFSYFIPVASGRYTLTLRFAESTFGFDPIAGVTRYTQRDRNRFFDVYCNGTTLLRDFDVLKEAEGRPIVVDWTGCKFREVALHNITVPVVPVFPGVTLSEVGLMVSEKLGAGSTLMPMTAVLVTPPPVAVKVAT